VGEEIPVEGRITAVADVFDALSSRRPYKPAFPLEKCFGILIEGSGTHFDPRCIDAFFAGRDEIMDVRLEHSDV
jgi:putative two-component system response regulator